jgi:hypothetical protein
MDSVEQLSRRQGMKTSPSHWLWLLIVLGAAFGDAGATAQDKSAMDRNSGKAAEMVVETATWTKMVAERDTLQAQNARLHEELAELQAELEAVKSRPPCPPTLGYDDVKGQLDGNGSAGKADSVTRKDFPDTPEGTDEWLSWHNGKLAKALSQRLGEKDMSALLGDEDRECGKDIYCQVARRRDTIELLLGSSR